MYKIKTVKFSAIILLLLIFPAISAGDTKLRVQKEKSFTISYSEKVYPGTPLYFFLKTNKKIEAVSGILYDNTGRILGTTEGFKVKKNNKEFSGYIPLSTFAPYPVQGIFELQIRRKEKTETVFFPVMILERIYPSYNLYLNDKNTAIMTESSNEKQEQSNLLYEIINNVSDILPYETGRFVKPVNTERITSPFGQRRVYIYSSGKKYTSLHYGIDFGVPKGTRVNAAGKGRVVFAGFRIVTGWSVIIEHAPGLYSLYYHMDSLKTREGNIVEQGEEIGISGSTGLSTGPHLHWEIRCRGQALDPFYFLEN